jgi:hypothetical protein
MIPRHKAAQQRLWADKQKTFARYKVWKGSATAPIKWAPISKETAITQLWAAERWEVGTKGTVIGRSGKISLRCGILGRAAVRVYRTLLLDFLNYKTGRCDPSWDAISKKCGYGRTAVGQALNSLEAAGLIVRINRASGGMVDGRFVLEQDTNAYGFPPVSQWKDYGAPPPPPPPDPDAWGKAPAPFNALLAAAQATAEGRHKEALRHWESDGGNPLALDIARLARRRQR